MKLNYLLNRRVLVVTGIALVLAIVSWRQLHSEPVTQLATSAATLADIEDTVIATGTMEASKLVSVGAQVSGQIKSLKVDLGDRVKAGDLIAEIDSTTQQNSLRNAEASLANVRAQRAEKEASLKQAELDFVRQKTMLDQDATSRADYDSAEASLATVKAQIDALDAQIVQSQTTVDTAKANLGYTRIVAPMDGTVVALVVKEGQTVNANQSAPTIVKLAKLDTMTVSAEISEADVVKVKQDLPVYFTILGAPEKRYYAKLRSIEPAPTSIETDDDSSSSSSSSAIYYNGLFDVDNPDGVLRISMTAQVHIVLSQAKQALTIPSSALGEKAEDGRYLVQVANNTGQAETRLIKLGINNGTLAQVLDGLSAGERVVVGDASAVVKTQSQRGGRGPMMM